MKLLNDHNVYIFGAGFSRARGFPHRRGVRFAESDPLPVFNGGGAGIIQTELATDNTDGRG